MTQYLIRTLTDSTGYTFTETIKARENETFTVVDAESKEDADRKSKDLIQCSRCKSQNIDYEYYCEDIGDPSYIYTICHNCKGIFLDSIRKVSE